MNEKIQIRRPARRRMGPLVEALETRQLLSTAGGHAHHRAAPPPLPPPSEAAKLAGDTMMSNPIELERSMVNVTLSGNFVVGPPRFQSQSSQTAMKLSAPTSLNGLQKYAVFAIFTPAMPGMPIQATAVLQAPHRPPGPPSRLVLKLMPVSSTESRVLPTKMAWEVDGSSSTGQFMGATGAGLVSLSYSGRGSHQVVPGSTQRGLVTAHFSGLAHQTGIPQLFRSDPGDSVD